MAMAGMKGMWRGFTRALAVLPPVLFLAAAVPAAGQAPSPVVVELFTSQGCSSCPPADALIEELTADPGVLPLSEHVDYWDYIGWKDPFSRPEATARQNAYARALNERFVYTPQIIVDGRTSVVGSRRHEVRAAIDEARRTFKVHPVASADGRVRIPGGTVGQGGPAAVWMVIFEREEKTRVERGENAGRTLTNANVVREWERIGTWTGQPLELKVDMAEYAGGSEGCAVIVQAANGTGPILGAVRVPIAE
jgi:hypothetical protein